MGPWSGSTDTAAAVVGVGVGEAGAGSRSLWRRVWCFNPQVQQENLLGQDRQPCLSESSSDKACGP